MSHWDALLKVKLAISKRELNTDTLFNIMDSFEKLSSISFVGCDNHKKLMTRKIIVYYLTIRMKFICRQANENACGEKKETKKKRKLAKLTSVVDPKLMETACDDPMDAFSILT